jgi:hypothetical protein
MPLTANLEADLLLGDRIDPGVYPGAPRSARQLLYVTLGNSRHSKWIIPRSVIRSTWPVSEKAIPLLTWWEPVSGFEPLTCRLQEAWPNATCALPAQMTRVIARIAPVALGLSGRTFHEPFHADEG